MKKVCFVLVLLLLLTGCQAKKETTTEYVEDGIEADQALPYLIVFGIPEEATQTTFGEETRADVYEAANGDYTIVTEVLKATSVDEAIEAISGIPAERLNIVQLQRFPMPEYHFAWSSTGEEGDSVSRAALIAAEDFYYVMTMTQKTGLGDTYRDTADYVFSTFGLEPQEIV